MVYVKKFKKENKLPLREKIKRKIMNHKMSANEEDDKLEYAYKMMKGMSYIQGAIHVFR